MKILIDILDIDLAVKKASQDKDREFLDDIFMIFDKYLKEGLSSVEIQIRPINADPIPQMTINTRQELEDFMLKIDPDQK